MRASSIMIFAVALALVGRWSHNKPTASVKAVIETVFAIIVVALLDQGETEGIAKGFAWLFLATVVLSNDSPLTGLAKATGTGTNNPGPVMKAPA
jgi:hypothetical protein